MEICKRKKRELEQLKNYYTENKEGIEKTQRMYVHCNEETKEEAKNVVCDFDNPDDVREMERLTHALNAQEKSLKIAEKQLLHLKELKKYIDEKEKKLNDFLDIIKPKIYINEHSEPMVGFIKFY